MKQKTDVLQGTLALMVLKTLDVLGPQHGYGIARRIEQISGDLLAVNQGTLYPVLLKLEQEGAIASAWGASENNRRARFYRLTRKEGTVSSCGSRPKIGNNGGDHRSVLRSQSGGFVMKSLGRFFHRLFHSATGRAEEERLREEIAEHLALQTEENLRAGLPPVEARRQAMLKFGGVEAMKQDYRAERGLVFIESLLGDLRNAGRSIGRMPRLAGVIILSLAIGIGVNTAIFSWIQLMLFEPMPGVSGASNFLLVEPHSETGGYPGASWLEYRDLQTQVPALRDIVAFQMVPFNVGERGKTERTFGQLVSGNYFSALGLKPAIGRFIRPDEVERSVTELVIVISYDYWQRRFGGAPGAVGQKVRVNERDLVIIGVAPEGFQGTTTPLKFELWAPATLMPVLLGGVRDLDDRSTRAFSLIGMLRHGGTREEAQAELTTTMAQLARNYPEASAGMAGRFFPSGNRRVVRNV